MAKKITRKSQVKENHRKRVEAIKQQVKGLNKLYGEKIKYTDTPEYKKEIQLYKRRLYYYENRDKISQSRKQRRIEAQNVVMNYQKFKTTTLESGPIFEVFRGAKGGALIKQLTEIYVGQGRKFYGQIENNTSTPFKFGNVYTSIGRFFIDLSLFVRKLFSSINSDEIVSTTCTVTTSYDNGNYILIYNFDSENE